VVHPNTQSLNWIAENANKVEALRAEITGILQAAQSTSNPSTPRVAMESAVDQTASAESSNIVQASAQHAVSKHIQTAPLRHRTSSMRAAKPKKNGTAPQPLTVSPGLMSRYNRKELYEKVWKVPMQRLAKEFGVSDVALAKTCKKLHIPVPGRGYWAKKMANQPVAARPVLPSVSIH
jgi:hypothetical protein